MLKNKHDLYGIITKPHIYSIPQPHACLVLSPDPNLHRKWWNGLKYYLDKTSSFFIVWQRNYKLNLIYFLTQRSCSVLSDDCMIMAVANQSPGHEEGDRHDRWTVCSIGKCRLAHPNGSTASDWEEDEDAEAVCTSWLHHVMVSGMNIPCHHMASDSDQPCPVLNLLL